MKSLGQEELSKRADPLSVGFNCNSKIYNHNMQVALVDSSDSVTLSQDGFLALTECDSSNILVAFLSGPWAQL